MKVRNCLKSVQQGKRSLLESSGWGAGDGPLWAVRQPDLPLTFPSLLSLLPQEHGASGNPERAHQDAAAGRLNPT